MKKLLAAVLVLVMVLGVPVSAGAEAPVDLDGMTLEQLLELQSAVSNKIADLKSEQSDHDGGVPLSTYERSVPNGFDGLPRLEKAKDLTGEFHHDLMVIESNFERAEEYSLKSQFSRLTGSLFTGYSPESDGRVFVKIFGDGALIYEVRNFDVEADLASAYDIEVDISGYNVLNLEVNGSGCTSYLSNMRLHP